MAPIDPPDYVHRLDELLHEVDELRDRINAAREQERRLDKRRAAPRESPERRVGDPAAPARARMFNAHH